MQLSPRAGSQGREIDLDQRNVLIISGRASSYLFDHSESRLNIGGTISGNRIESNRNWLRSNG